MLTVALVATFATTALWQQWGSIEVERAERQRLQVTWMLSGALDWARLILREDARADGGNGPDHLNEPWAMALQEARLSTFLAADRNNTGAIDLDNALDAFLSGSVQDAQAKMNVTTLIANTTIDAAQKARFSRLFDTLGLRQSELDTLCTGLLQSQTTTLAPNSNSPVPLKPQRFRQLAWLGLSASTLTTLAPFVTLLPNPSPINLNTAPVEVIYASVPNIDMAQARQAVQRRATTPFLSLEQAALALGISANQLQASQHAISSKAFFVYGRMRLDETTLQEVSLVERLGIQTKTIWRERVVLPPAAATPLQ